ncbi:isoleucine--tRNA ligase [Desulfonatronovibrio hydrogenovorans]|uniref:isoleucine--tRNA ligase n=1 Tax=Desulfonatronovibrio hydrogenovorans TaxID=53245 RepID=UPI00048C9405|nr:isoleucine--tRNA ligase [Desulfonatronovibrio hydrogenovorans]
MTDYKKTLNLPKTSFPMRANLTQNEPRMLEFWKKINAYQQMVHANQEGQPYVLHDGPPYANGHIHMGTAMNKVLKDFIVKSRNMQGFRAEYVPGWDCHGLPIEHKVAQELRAKNKVVPPIVIRRICREYAAKFLDIQRKEFIRLGVMGQWDDPYQTMHPAYEAATARELGNFIKKGSVVRGKKPIYWCIDCETALAEAEVEYADHTSPSIYVAFPVTDLRIREVFSQADPAATFAVIWTTTPWTIPGNTAVAVHPEFEYSLVKSGAKFFILASEQVKDLSEIFGWNNYEVLGRATGKDLEGIKAVHPFMDRQAPVVLADYVTLEAGTGLVHTAPGHGREDYETGQKYGLEVLSPLDDQGRFLEEVGFLAGQNVYQANPLVIEKLKSSGLLLAEKKISHSYPHCWRCKQPVIFRATTQWFISMDKNDLRQKALEAITNDVEWIPSWGRQRIYSMIENRPDWCISRQRNWGVPIIALLCAKCDHTYMDPDWIFSITDRFEKHERGCDYWFEADITDVVPEDLTCPDCGSREWKKEDDILDVWFDSGTSFAAVLEKRPECAFPADMYLEGTDQHRGWFHSSLLASMGTRGQAPYRSVLTHGYVVDGDGRKMSKSLGNVIAPQEIIDKFGAEILRIWVAAVDYQEDVRISDEILNRLVDAYRRIRNTSRYFLGNLFDFDPGQDMVEPRDMLDLDRYALSLVLEKHQAMQKAYNRFEFHKIFHTLHNLCVVELSSFYLDIIKDRLYVYAPGSLERRSAQTSLYLMLQAMLANMAPVLSFTAEEIYQHLPEQLRTSSKTVFGLRPDFSGYPLMDEDEKSLWNMVYEVRQEVTKAIEPYRKSKELGHSLDSLVTLYVDETKYQSLKELEDDLGYIFIVSRALVRPEAEAPAGIFSSLELEGLKIKVERAPGEKCARCWIYSQDLDQEKACPRCAGIIREIQGTRQD